MQYLTQPKALGIGMHRHIFENKTTIIKLADQILQNHCNLLMYIVLLNLAIGCK